MVGIINRNFILCLVLFLLMSTSSSGNPFLKAIPLEDVDYYVISIDGKQISISPSFDTDMLFYNLQDLEDGMHIVEIICGSYDFGEGESVIFKIQKRTEKKYIRYRIKKIKSQEKVDPFYNDRFDEDFLEVKIKKIEKEKRKKKKK